LPLLLTGNEAFGFFPKEFQPNFQGLPDHHIFVLKL
jgi:hypothetical protein